MVYNKTTDLWEDCATEIFTYGDVNTEYTGGLTAYGTVTINYNQNGIIKINQVASWNTYFRSNAPINWTNFNTVYFIAVRGEKTRTGTIGLYYADTNINTLRSATQINELILSGNTNNQQYQISTNFIIGNHYFVMGGSMESPNSVYCDISRIYVI